MKDFQVRNIASGWKVTEKEVWEIIKKNGGLEKATFKKVDGHFKNLDWERRKAEWNKFKGISIKFSNKKLTIADGLTGILKKFFDQDDIHQPPGWDRALSINMRYVTFSQTRVFGSKNCNSNTWYMYIKVHGTRKQMLDRTMDFDANQVYVVPWSDMTKPIKEEGQPKLNFMDYIKKMADTTFTQGQMDQWIKEEKLRTYTGRLTTKGW